MVQLTRALQELYRRTPDECFATVDDLLQYTRHEREFSQDRWHLPQVLAPRASASQVTVSLEDDGPHLLNHWSFAQLCRLAGINIETVNRLSPETASRALQETLPSAEKPIQLLTTGNMVRSLHGVVYTRLWNEDLMSVVREFASDFEPPQTGIGGATGLYCGEQDLFAFLIDPTGWTEIGGESFAPGFFVWNSEVGAGRSASRHSGSNPSAATIWCGMQSKLSISLANTQPKCKTVSQRFVASLRCSCKSATSGVTHSFACSLGP